MTYPSSLRLALINLLAQYAKTGVQVNSLQQTMPAVDRQRIVKTLENMRRDEIAHSVRAEGSRITTWFPGQEPSDPNDPRLSPRDFKRIERARRMDREQPLLPCGSNLPGGRCASVWAYSRAIATAHFSSTH